MTKKKPSGGLEAINEEAKKETMLAVGWIPATNPGPEIFRGRVLANVGIVEPALTSGEMEQIAFAAKMEVIRCLRRRRRSRP